MKNINVDELKKAVQSGNVDSYMNKNLPPDAQQRVKQVLSDKNATEKLLNTPEAKALMQKFMKK
ncbi:hypothetical protein [uncultured Eubacterium sp.]|uniref:hypothetical protein n=1 Tax=uncultured Eubacterium sp. TaxID=165185 RepID=UPI00261CC07B|nr:hypothetical protein [uncultured Eubacterium sp.]